MSFKSEIRDARIGKKTTYEREDRVAHELAQVLNTTARMITPSPSVRPQYFFKKKKEAFREPYNVATV